MHDAEYFCGQVWQVKLSEDSVNSVCLYVCVCVCAYVCVHMCVL